ncbi:DUF1028 domain-containing protein [soil metagenome]
MTFSLLGRCAGTGMVGCVVSSSSQAVGARCLYVRAGVGAAASQNITYPRLGPRLLDLLAAGSSPSEAIDALVAQEPNVEYRQLAAVDLEGRTAAFSGSNTLGVHAAAEGDGAVAAGNLLADTGVPEAMVEAFERSAGDHLGDRLIAALTAGLDAGGEAGPVRAAGLLVADQVSWPVADRRVDWSDDPIGELAALWGLWKPEMGTYVTRALEPSSAPGFGVPGDR